MISFTKHKHKELALLILMSVQWIICYSLFSWALITKNSQIFGFFAPAILLMAIAATAYSVKNKNSWWVIVLSGLIISTVTFAKIIIEGRNYFQILLLIMNITQMYFYKLWCNAKGLRISLKQIDILISIRFELMTIIVFALFITTIETNLYELRFIMLALMILSGLNSGKEIKRIYDLHTNKLPSTSS